MNEKCRILKQTINIHKYCTIEAIDDLTIQFSTLSSQNPIYYSINGAAWQLWTGIILIPAGYTVSFKGSCEVKSTSIGIGQFVMNTGRFNLLGNYMSLLNPEVTDEDLTVPAYAFISLFQGLNVVQISSSFLPATTLNTGCYRTMFNNCIYLNNAPDLPALNLVSNCYYRMFYGCSSLNYIKALFITPPSLTYTSGWVSGVYSTGTFVKNKTATWNVMGSIGVPTGWTIVRE